MANGEGVEVISELASELPTWMAMASPVGGKRGSTVPTAATG